MNLRLQSIMEMTYSFASIDRDMYYPHREKSENDAEHVFQLALIAWHIIEVDKLKLDTSKVFKLCLAHDLVEIYSGDVPLWGKSGHDEKKSRELAALETLKEKLPDVPDITDVIFEYKERQTEEAKFVYAVDKLTPLLNQLNIEGKVWKNHNVTLEMVIEVISKYDKVSPYLTKYFDEAMLYLKENKERYFSV